MKILFIVFHIFLLPFFVFAQTNSSLSIKKITIDSIHHEFEKYLSGPDSLGIVFNPLKNSLLSGFYDDNELIIEYIGSNYEALKTEYELGHISATKRFVKTVVDSQYRNLVFERCLPLMYRYLKLKSNLKIENMTIADRPKIKEQVIQSYAVNFFYPDTITPEGHIGTHVCIGFNGFQSDEQRNLMLEAFCWQVVNPRFEDGTPLSKDFDEAIDVMRNLSLAKDKETKLLRAQGVIWALMAKSPALKEAIWSEYRRMKNWLTFEME